MRNFFYRVSGAIARFMYVRNGTDQLNAALLAAYLLVWLVQILLNRNFTVRMVLEAVSLVLAALVLFRTFSRNLPRRQAENAKFLSWWYPVRNRFAVVWQRHRDKEHKYFVCKNCGTVCRVPAGKGKVEITCPKCGEKIIGKS